MMVLRGILAALAALQDQVDRKLLLSYPMLWAARVHQVVTRIVVFEFCACLLLWLLPVDLHTPWVPSSDQVFYSLGIVAVFLLARWTLVTARRWRSPVPDAQLSGNAVGTFVLASVIVALFASVPFVAAHMQRAHIQSTIAEAPALDSYRWLRDVAGICASLTPSVCAEHPYAEPTLWRDHPTCTALFLWNDLSRLYPWQLEAHERIPLVVMEGELVLVLASGEQRSVQEFITPERVVTSLAGFISDTNLDPRGVHLAALREYREAPAEPIPYQICGESMRRAEPLHAAIVRVNDRISALLTEFSGSKSPNHVSANIYGFLGLYLVLLLALLPFTPRGAKQVTPWFLVSLWGLTSFVAAFTVGWEQQHFADLAVIAWASSAVIAAFMCRWRRTWHIAAAAGFAAMLLTPLVPFLLVWEVPPRSPYFFGINGGVYDIIIDMLTGGPKGEARTRGSWCLGAGWVLCCGLLVPYQWLAARANSLPSGRS